MKTMQNFGMKRLLSLLLILCMTLTLFPTVVSASSTGVTSVYLGGQKLDSNNPYLRYGWKSSTGTLGIDGCTAYFDSASGTLTLKDYDGGEINADGSGKRDLTVKLIGNNIITNKIVSSQAWGINLKSSSGNLTITAEQEATLKINVTSNYQAIGIVVDYGEKGDKGNLTIGGNAKVEVIANSDNGRTARDNQGIFCDGDITIKHDACFKTILQSLSYDDEYRGVTKAIILGNNVTIDTSGDIYLDNYGYFPYGSRPMIRAFEKVNIEKVGIMAFKGKSYAELHAKTVELAPNVLYTPKGLERIAYYRSGDIYNLKIAGGENEYGKNEFRYLVGDTVTVTEPNIPVGFGFKEWSGTSGLTFLDGTSKEDATMKFKMPKKNLSIFAVFKSAIFEKQPVGKTVAVGKPIDVSWKTNSVAMQTLGLLESKVDGKWTVVTALETSYLEREIDHKYRFNSNVPSSQTYRLHFIGSLVGVDPDHYSDEFTLNWEDASVTSISVSPLTAQVQKGTTQQFTSDVIVEGPYEETKSWSVMGSESDGTKIDQNGVLTVAPDETAKILWVQATSLEDRSKSAMSTVNVVNEPVTKYAVSVVSGTCNPEKPGVNAIVENGESVSVKANPDSAGKRFVKWISTDIEIHEDDVDKREFDFTMPDKNVVIIATYENTEPLEQLEGKVQIQRTAKLGETVEAKVHYCNEEELYYEWIEDIPWAGPEISKTNYKIQDDVPGIGFPIICQVTSPNKSGSIIGVGGIITPKDGKAITGVVANDVADTLTGMTTAMEYSIDGGKTWVPYISDEKLPDLHGNVIVEVRFKYTGSTEAGPATTFVFTDSGLKSIKITKPATKTVYKIGELLDIEGLEVTGTYEGDTTKVETITKKMITGFESETVGSKTLTVNVGGKTATYDISIEKSKPSAPAAPVVVSRTKNSVTFAKNSNNEFSKDNGISWQNSEEFIGLDTGTTYTFITRVKETDIAYASDPSPGTVITLSLPSIIGPVSIIGTTTYLETLEADISNLDNVGISPTYQWFRDGIDIPGATAKAYKLVEDDIGKSISVKVLADPLVGFGFVLSGPTMAIEKLDGPAAPKGITSTNETKAGLNDGTLVGTEIGQEYKINDSSEWIPITGNTVTGLAPESYIVVRVAETPTHKAGATTSYYYIAGAEAPLDGGDSSDGGSSSGGGSSAPISYIITTSAGQGGSFDTAKTVSVKAGASTKFNIKANEGYVIEDVKVDGKSVGAINYYEFKNVSTNHTISVVFKKIEDMDPKSDMIYNFTDVLENEWYYEPIMAACEKGWFSGTSDTTFSPNTPMTRGMIVTVLWRIEGEPAANANSFNDVKAGNYYTTAVNWAAKQGIVNGYGNNLFGPNESITREQMAAILYRYAQYKGYDTTQGGMAIKEFADYGNISEYALPTLSWAVNTELIQGSGNNLMPKDSATRGQVAAILVRFSQKLAN